ncbi:copper ion binding protein [Tautonia plasticadhaerens]|nr:copper ion binding protein [Tautonia plasticadhaerens]
MTETDGKLVRLTVAGMTCDHCVRAVRKAIESVPGVRSASVDLASGRAEARVIPGWVDEQGLRASVAQAGYEASIEPASGEVAAADPTGDGDSADPEADPDGPSPPPAESRPADLVTIGAAPGLGRLPEPPACGSSQAVEFSITGMHCASCVSRVEHALSGVPGVNDAWVNLATERARIVVDRDRFDQAALERVVSAAGYGVKPTRPDDDPSLAAEAMRRDREERVS